MAGRGTDIKLSSELEANGGLHVILTEFHESARVDRQLFGRSARQGDPGTTEAIVCMRDELFIRYAPYLSALLTAWLYRQNGKTGMCGSIRSNAIVNGSRRLDLWGVCEKMNVNSGTDKRVVPHHGS